MEVKPRIHTSGSKRWRQLKPAARGMRAAPTEAEDRLWQAIRANKLGTKFRRQHAIGRFIVDFYSSEQALIVEVDGPIHDGQKTTDQLRDAELEAKGFRVLRIGNERVMDDLPGVVDAIRARIQPHPPAPSPPRLRSGQAPEEGEERAARRG